MQFSYLVQEYTGCAQLLKHICDVQKLVLLRNCEFSEYVQSTVSFMQCILLRKTFELREVQKRFYVFL